MAAPQTSTGLQYSLQIIAASSQSVPAVLDNDFCCVFSAVRGYIPAVVTDSDDEEEKDFSGT